MLLLVLAGSVFAEPSVCTLDLTGGPGCADPAFVVEGEGPQRVITARLDDDGRDLRRLDVFARVCDPDGWVLHLANAPDAADWGSAGAPTDMDAEVVLLGTTLRVRSTADPALPPPSRQTVTVPGVLPRTGCTLVHLGIADEGDLSTLAFSSGGAPIEVQGPRGLRADFGACQGPDDPFAGVFCDGLGGGVRRWRVSVGRAVGSAFRDGSGVEQLCLVLGEDGDVPSLNQCFDGAIADADEDGVPDRLDCAPHDPDRAPGNAEVCNGIDDDCDGLVDDEDDGMVGGSVRWHDGDGDGYGGGVGVPSCRVYGAGVGGDCDDDDPSVHPEADDLPYDGVDRDCSGGSDYDADGDGDDAIPWGSDCDDHDPERYGDRILRVPEDVDTIQGAIALACDGDVVEVGPGTWYENLDFLGRSITVTSRDGRDATVIDGGWNGPVVRFASGEDAYAVLSELTLTHGSGEVRPDGTIRGGGVFVFQASPTLVGLAVVANEVEGSGYGAGISLNYSDALVEDVVLLDNLSSYYGGGIAVSLGSPRIRNVLAARNDAVYGGGIALYATSGPVLQNAILAGNLDDGLTIHYGSPLVRDVTTVGNVLDGIETFDTQAVLEGVVSTDNGGDALTHDGTRLPSFAWCDLHGTVAGIASPVGQDGNLGADPLLSGLAGDVEDWRVWPGPGSPLVDAGDPARLDPNGTTADMGAFGGPGAADWDLDRDGRIGGPFGDDPDDLDPTL